MTRCCSRHSSGSGECRGGARTGRSFAVPAARATRRSAGCRSSGAKRRTSRGRRRSPVSAGRHRSSPTAASGSRPRSSSAAFRCARSPSMWRPGREVVNVEVFKIPADRRDINPKNSWASPTPVLDGDRVYVHFGADGTAALSSIGRDHLEAPLRVPVATRRRRIADRLWRSADLQLRRQRRRVRDRARQAHRQDEVEDQSRLSGRSGLHDAARHSRRRSRSADQRRRVSRARLRSADRQGDLARPLRRGLLERAAAGVRARPGVHRDRIPAARAAGGSSRRDGRRDQDPRRVVAEAWRAADAVADHRRRRALHRERRRHRAAASTREAGPSSGSSGWAAPIRRRRFLPMAAYTFWPSKA